MSKSNDDLEEIKKVIVGAMTTNTERKKGEVTVTSGTLIASFIALISIVASLIVFIYFSDKGTQSDSIKQLAETVKKTQEVVQDLQGNQARLTDSVERVAKSVDKNTDNISGIIATRVKPEDFSTNIKPYDIRIENLEGAVKNLEIKTDNLQEKMLKVK